MCGTNGWILRMGQGIFVIIEINLIFLQIKTSTGSIRKQPYFFRFPNNRILTMAGLFDIVGTGGKIRMRFVNRLNFVRIPQKTDDGPLQCSPLHLWMRWHGSMTECQLFSTTHPSIPGSTLKHPYPSRFLFWSLSKGLLSTTLFPTEVTHTTPHHLSYHNLNSRLCVCSVLSLFSELCSQW